MLCIFSKYILNTISRDTSEYFKGGNSASYPLSQAAVSIILKVKMNQFQN